MSETTQPSVNLSPAYQNRPYPSYPQPNQLYHPNQTHWLTLASPVAKASPFGPPFVLQDSTLSSDLERSNMASSRPQQLECRDYLYDSPELEGRRSDGGHPHLPLSAFENTSIWGNTPSYDLSSGHLEDLSMLPPPQNIPSNAYPGLMYPSSPYSTASMYDESPLQSPYFSSPEIAYAGFAGQPPRSYPNEECDFEEEEDPMGGKPYARLIYEALSQAPGRRMMLRDIYEWFENNTSKPRESGTNGWQNSIRHNLSMNHAFENDKTQSTNARGEPKKATSVWFLTEHAIRNGVQSTTRYRKNGGARKSALNGRPDAQRARSGAKGGRAARRAARLRALEQSPHMSWVSPVTPGDLDSFNHLIHAANAMNDLPPTRSNSPPSPPEQYPYTPVSLELGEDLSAMNRHNTKYENREGLLEDYTSRNLSFPQPFDSNLDDGWFEASQQS